MKALAINNTSKAQIRFLQDFYSPLHKKLFVASDPKKNTLEIDVDEDGVAIHSFWNGQLKDEANQIRDDKDYIPFFSVMPSESPSESDKPKPKK